MAISSASATAVKGVAVRLLYAIHVIICLWKVMGIANTISDQDNLITENLGHETVKKFKYYLTGIIGFYLLITVVECAIIVKRKGGEWKWFSPSVLLYLVMVVPCIWVVEWKLFFDRMKFLRNNTISTCSTDDFVHQREDRLVLLGFPHNEDFRNEYGFTTREWSLGLQHIMLFVLIIGRWLSPKGDITRDELSQLLMVYFGTAADILEYVTEGLSSSGVMCNKKHVFIVLVVWSLSLSQFTLIPTATRKRKRNRVGARRQMSYVCICFETEIWSIFVSTFVQDGPFLGTRMFFMIVHNSRNQSSIFFTCKNALLLLIQAYRVVIICNNYVNKKKKLKALATKPRREKVSRVNSTSTTSCCCPPITAPCKIRLRSIRKKKHCGANNLNNHQTTSSSTSYNQPKFTKGGTSKAPHVSTSTLYAAKKKNSGVSSARRWTVTTLGRYKPGNKLKCSEPGRRHSSKSVEISSNDTNRYPSIM